MGGIPLLATSDSTVSLLLNIAVCSQKTLIIENLEWYALTISFLPFVNLIIAFLLLINVSLS